MRHAQTKAAERAATNNKPQFARIQYSQRLTTWQLLRSYLIQPTILIFYAVLALPEISGAKSWGTLAKPQTHCSDEQGCAFIPWVLIGCFSHAWSALANKNFHTIPICFVYTEIFYTRNIFFPCSDECGVHFVWNLKKSVYYYYVLYL
jgi:hypothetical protein